MILSAGLTSAHKSSSSITSATARSVNQPALVCFRQGVQRRHRRTPSGRTEPHGGRAAGGDRFPGVRPMPRIVGSLPRPQLHLHDDPRFGRQARSRSLWKTAGLSPRESWMIFYWGLWCRDRRCPALDHRNHRLASRRNACVVLSQIGRVYARPRSCSPFAARGYCRPSIGNPTSSSPTGEELAGTCRAGRSPATTIFATPRIALNRRGAQWAAVTQERGRCGSPPQRGAVKFYPMPAE